MARRVNSDALLSLADAVSRFAPRRLKVAHQHASSQPQLQSKTLPEGASVPESISAFFAQFQKVTDDLRASNEPVWEMQQYLLQQLASEKLAAFGVMTKPEVGHDRQPIPPFVFDNSPKVNWAKNTIENAGHRFEAVKVRQKLEPENASSRSMHKSLPEKGRASKMESDNRSTTRHAASGKRGRPSVRDDVIAAMESLLQGEPQTTFSPHKIWVPKIRERVHQLFNSADPPKYAPDKPAERTIMSIIPKGLEQLRRK